MSKGKFTDSSLEEQLDVLRPVLERIKIGITNGSFFTADENYKMFRWTLVIDNAPQHHQWYFNKDGSICISKMVEMFGTNVTEEVYMKKPVFNDWINSSFKNISDNSSLCTRCCRCPPFIDDYCNHCLEVLFNHIKIDNICAICMDCNFVSSTTLPCKHMLHEDCTAMLCKSKTKGKCPKCAEPFNLIGYDIGWLFEYEYLEDAI